MIRNQRQVKCGERIDLRVVVWSTPPEVAALAELYLHAIAELPTTNTCSESRSSLSRGVALSTSPTGSTRSSSAREFSLLKPGAEGRLLVPDVKMRRINSSVSSVGGSSSTSWGSQSAIFSNTSVSGRKRSPLSRQNSDASVDSVETESDEDSDAVREAACSLPSIGKSRPAPSAYSLIFNTILGADIHH